jgi:hypothetical protein
MAIGGISGRALIHRNVRHAHGGQIEFMTAP